MPTERDDEGHIRPDSRDVQQFADRTAQSAEVTAGMAADVADRRGSATYDTDQKVHDRRAYHAIKIVIGILVLILVGILVIAWIK